MYHQLEITIMADAKKYELTPMEAMWVKKSLEAQRNILVRNRLKEVVGSEIYALRGKEIDALSALVLKFT